MSRTAALLACLLLAVPASAQTGSRHRFEVAVGGTWLGGASAGDETATLRANSTSGSPFSVFTTDSEIHGTAGIETRVGFGLTQMLIVEGLLVYSRPELRTRISNDVENAQPVTVTENLDQYFVGADVVWQLTALRFSARTLPFVVGGAGYLRQLHEGGTLIESGQVYHVGGGIRHSLMQRTTGFVKTTGVRADAGLFILANGIDFEDRARPHAAVSGSLVVGF
jgi:hypothetical protein